MYVYPNEFGQTLTQAVIEHKPNKILEFGAGTGYTALQLANGCLQNGFGKVHTHDIWHTGNTFQFKTFSQDVFLRNIKLFPDLEKLIDYKILDYKLWLYSNKETITDFDMIYFDINNDGDKILEIFNILNIPENKNKVLLFEGGHPDRNPTKYRNVTPIHADIVKETTQFKLIFNAAPGIIKILL